MKNIIKLIASLFYLGYFPVAPGTVASFAGVVLYLLFANNLAIYLFVTAIFLILGFVVSGKAEEIFAKKDARQIVIDEVSGMLISLLFLPRRPVIIILAFLVFRLFDILKPPPIRRLEAIRGGAGVMLDDILAGIYTNLIFRLALI